MKWSYLALGALSISMPAGAMSEGEYVARAGDCAACHSVPGKPPLSGGLALPMPVGMLYTTNITPDAEQGIGRYTFDEFDRAMRQGIARDGHRLYPAMPYTAYARLSEHDMRALYAYLIQDVSPAAVPNESPGLWAWLRWGLFLWNGLFHRDATPYRPDAAQSDAWNRGAYLVQGAGHCGTCHTPRGIALQEKGQDEEQDDYLAGAITGGWYAPSLRAGNLSAEEIMALLSSGRSEEGAVAGPMGEVVAHSTRYLAEADLNAIAAYLTGLRQIPMPPQVPVVLSSSAQARAANDYVQYCSACHGDDGRGEPHVIPALAGSRAVMQPDPTSLIRVMLEGVVSPVGPTSAEYTMPGIGWTLDDAQVAGLINFLRSQWGNRASEVMPAQVKALRGDAPPAS